MGQPSASTISEIALERVTPGGGRQSIHRSVAEEIPIALEFNGIGYAVLMATPADIGDLITGFAWSERLAQHPDDIAGFALHWREPGVVARVQLTEHAAERVVDRVRHRVTDSGCGLCGVENLAQALRPLPPIMERADVSDEAVFRALTLIEAAQPLNRQTGAMHAAALCAPDGRVLLVREDVGRHNAFDKLIGAMMATQTGWAGGFALLSSRCSQELVEKAVLAGCPMLVTVSAPTALAVRRAQEAGLTLIVLARPDALLRHSANTRHPPLLEGSGRTG